jgi:hypothetical protein
MDQQKIDRLFREKMDNLEVMPSAGAWAQVEKQIRPKKSFKIYWAAAAVTLLFASWLFWPTQVNLELTPIASEVNQPPFMEIPDFIMIEIKVVKRNENAPLKKNVAISNQGQLVAKKESKEVIKPLIEDIPLLEMETKSAVAIAEIEQPAVIDKLITENTVAISPVKITYIASASNSVNEELQKTDSASAFKKFIAFAEKIDPGEVLADFKTAKDNLLNNGFKKKEKNSL